MNTKQCSKCKKIKEVSLFSKNRNTIDGLQSICKACQRVYLNNKLYGNSKRLLQQSKIYHKGTKYSFTIIPFLSKEGDKKINTVCIDFDIKQLDLFKKIKLEDMHKRFYDIKRKIEKDQGNILLVLNYPEQNTKVTVKKKQHLMVNLVIYIPNTTYHCKNFFLEEKDFFMEICLDVKKQIEKEINVNN